MNNIGAQKVQIMEHSVHFPEDSRVIRFNVEIEKSRAMPTKREDALWAPVDIQKVFPTGDRALIEGEVEFMIQLFGGGRGCRGTS